MIALDLLLQKAPKLPLAMPWLLAHPTHHQPMGITFLLATHNPTASKRVTLEGQKISPLALSRKEALAVAGSQQDVVLLAPETML